MKTQSPIRNLYAFRQHILAAEFLLILLVILPFVANGQSKSEANATGETLGPKKPGIVRIGVVLPRVASSGETQTEANMEEAFRAAITETLRGPGVEVTPLQYKLKRFALAFALITAMSEPAVNVGNRHRINGSSQSGV